MDTSTPRLFTQNGTETYASAASDSSERSTASETDEDLRTCCDKMGREEEAYWEGLRVSKGRKRVIPPPSGSDEEEEAPSKKSMASEPPSPPQ